MCKNTVGKKIIASFLFLLLGVAVSSVETACNAEQGGQPVVVSENARQEDVTGAWSGRIKRDNDKEAAVIFRIGSLKMGAKDSRLEYLNPLSCDLQAQYSGTENGRLVFGLSSSSGGYCGENLESGNLKAKSGEDANMLSIEIYNSDGQLLGQGRLSRQ